MTTCRHCQQRIVANGRWGRWVHVVSRSLWCGLDGVDRAEP